MSDWQLWLALSVMLSFGGIFKVGLFLEWFALAALSTASFGGVLGLDLAGQLQMFLLLSAISISLRRIYGKQKTLNRS